MMDHSFIEEHQVIDRYLMGRLSEEESARFEEHYFHCGDCLEQLKLADKLQRGLKREVVRDAARVEVSRQLGVLAWLTRPGASRQLRLAAALLLALALPASFLVQRLDRVGEDLEQARRPQINTPIFFLAPERDFSMESSEPSYRVRLSSTPEWLVFSLELDPPLHASYRVLLLADDGNEVWRGDGLELDHRDALVLSLHSSWLQAADYQLRVDTDPSEGEPLAVAQFPFRVLPAD